MKYRQLSPTGDYTFQFFNNSPRAVGQAILTRLKLFYGELFYATTSGVPYSTQVIGLTNQQQRDQVVQNTIVSTQGVTSLNSFSSNLDDSTRVYTFEANVTTQYSTTPITVSSTL